MSVYSMRRMQALLSSLVMTIVLGACQSPKASSEGESVSFDAEDFAHIVQVKYAKGFAVDNYPSYKRLSILSPQSRDTIASYILYPRDSVKPQLPELPNRQFIAIPQRSMACSASPEIGAVSALGLSDKLVAAASLEYVNDSTIRERIDRHQVVEIGRGMGRNIEQLIATRPDVCLQNVYSASDKDEDIKAAGINILFFNSWKEEDPLGRAEWLKVLALLFERNQYAEQIFDDIVRRYKEVQTLVPPTRPKVPVMYGQDYKGVWYVPGEYSYIAKLFSDAAIEYDYIAGQSDSQPMSFEYIYSKHHAKKIWLCMMTGKLSTLSDFVALNERYRDFEATRSGAVWVDRKRVNAYGGNDYWESGPYNPDLLLKDLLKICHPDLVPDYEGTYWIQLKR